MMLRVATRAVRAPRRAASTAAKAGGQTYDAMLRYTDDVTIQQLVKAQGAPRDVAQIYSDWTSGQRRVNDHMINALMEHAVELCEAAATAEARTAALRHATEVYLFAEQDMILVPPEAGVCLLRCCLAVDTVLPAGAPKVGWAVAHTLYKKVLAEREDNEFATRLSHAFAEQILKNCLRSAPELLREITHDLKKHTAVTVDVRAVPDTKMLLSLLQSKATSTTGALDVLLQAASGGPRAVVETQDAKVADVMRAAVEILHTAAEAWVTASPDKRRQGGTPAVPAPRALSGFSAHQLATVCENVHLTCGTGALEMLVVFLEAVRDRPFTTAGDGVDTAGDVVVSGSTLHPKRANRNPKTAHTNAVKNISYALLVAETYLGGSFPREPERLALVDANARRVLLTVFLMAGHTDNAAELAKQMLLNQPDLMDTMVGHMAMEGNWQRVGELCKYVQRMRAVKRRDKDAISAAVQLGMLLVRWHREGGRVVLDDNDEALIAAACKREGNAADVPKPLLVALAHMLLTHTDDATTVYLLSLSQTAAAHSFAVFSDADLAAFVRRLYRAGLAQDGIVRVFWVHARMQTLCLPAATEALLSILLTASAPHPALPQLLDDIASMPPGAASPALLHAAAACRAHLAAAAAAQPPPAASASHA